MTNTGLRVSWSRQNEEYEDMSSFDPTELWSQSNHGRRTKDEWNAGVSQAGRTATVTTFKQCERYRH